MKKGCSWFKDNRYFFLTPGPPNELEWLFENEILPYLVKEFNLTETILSKIIKIMGIGNLMLRIY